MASPDAPLVERFVRIETAVDGARTPEYRTEELARRDGPGDLTSPVAAPA